MKDFELFFLKNQFLTPERHNYKTEKFVLISQQNTVTLIQFILVTFIYILNLTAMVLFSNKNVTSVTTQDANVFKSDHDTEINSQR